jgi:hypothetical protein
VGAVVSVDTSSPDELARWGKWLVEAEAEAESVKAKLVPMLVAYYKADWSPVDMAKATGLTRTRIYALLKGAGVKPGRGARNKWTSPSRLPGNAS